MVGLHLANTKTTSPSEFLETAVSNSNRTVLNDASDSYMRKINIMKDSGGPNATMNLAARNLDQMGYTKSHSFIMNSPKMLAKMMNQMQVSISLSGISTIYSTDNVDKKKMYTDSLICLAPPAKIKLASKISDVMKLTKKNCLLLLVSHNTLVVDNKYNKKCMASMLSDKIWCSLLD